MTIYNVNSQILTFCPRFLLDQRWKSLSLCPAAPFLDVSVSRSIGNTVRKCRCRRVGFETNSRSIAVRWWLGLWRNGSDTFPVRFPANRKIWRVPRGESETPPSDLRHGSTCPYWRWTCGAWLPRGPVTRRRTTRSRDNPLNSSISGDWSSQSPLFFSWVDALHLPCLHLHGLAGPLLSTFCGNGRDKTCDCLKNGISRGCRLSWIFRW
jgi:hypothetical protein